jgi:hypothetical protein
MPATVIAQRNGWQQSITTPRGARGRHFDNSHSQCEPGAGGVKPALPLATQQRPIKRFLGFARACSNLFGEARLEPAVRLDVVSEFIVAAAQVLNKCMPATDHLAQRSRFKPCIGRVRAFSRP